MLEILKSRQRPADKSLLSSFTLKAGLFLRLSTSQVEHHCLCDLGDLIMLLLVRARALNMPCRLQGNVGFDTSG